ncbi:MAG TPA: hypothetical protein VGB76_22285 [Pyrinomonadaceae bacterium]|jgi:hypothetical protein
MSELNGTTNTTSARLTQRAARAERNRRLESIKMERRRARRGKWSQEIKPHANLLLQSAKNVN